VNKHIEVTDDTQVYVYQDGTVGFITPGGTVFWNPQDPDDLRVVPLNSSEQVHTIRPTAFPSRGNEGERDRVFVGLRLTQVNQPRHTL